MTRLKFTLCQKICVAAGEIFVLKKIMSSLKLPELERNGTLKTIFENK